MPEKLDRCVADVKGKVDNPWAVCNASLDINKDETKLTQESIYKQIIDTKCNRKYNSKCECKK